MSEAALKVVVAVDALAIIGYALATWGADVLPPALTVAVVAGMVAQLAVVLRPRRPGTPPPSP